ncbi:kinase-like domain-containing protein, partial [Hyaloscypha finlandica]
VPYGLRSLLCTKSCEISASRHHYKTWCIHHDTMFCLRSFNTTVPYYILKLATIRGASRYHPATHVCAPANMQSIFGGRGRQPFGSQLSLLPELLPLGIAVPGYRPEYFYPANPGDVLSGRYELKAKIGWGSSSTVWLARDTRSGGWLKPNKYVAIKICACNSATEEDIRHELDMTIHISSANSEHRGRAIIATAIESFGLHSPTGSTHLSLVTRPLMPLIKTYLQILLEGLDYLHSECHVIHTDLKLDNILVTFDDQSIIAVFVQAQTMHPMARKHVGDRTVYRCHNGFGRIDSDDVLKKMHPKMTDPGPAQRGDHPGPLVHPIQPNDCHAPEVLLGSLLIPYLLQVWELFGVQGLFLQGNPQSYSAVQHLAEMMALLGPVPPVLIQRERAMRQWRWSSEALNPEGRWCSNAAEFYGGPFFTDNGTFVGKDLMPYTRSWRSEMPTCIPEEDADPFFKFMRRMLCWLPEERATAKELKNDPWFGRII